MTSGIPLTPPVAAGVLAPTFDVAEYRRRWQALQDVLRRAGVACAVLSQARNVLYYAGMALHGHVVVPADGDPVLLAQIDSARARAISAVPQVLESRGMPTLVQTVQELGCQDERIGVEHDFLTVTAHRRLLRALPRADLVDVGDAALLLRRHKSAAELAVLRHAAAASDRQFDLIRERARPGMSEVELHAELTLLQRRLGMDWLSAKHTSNDRFIEPWVVSGPHTSQVSGHWLTMTGPGPSPGRPYGPTNRVFEPGDLLCCDIGTAYHGYHVDHARTYTFGRPTSRQRFIWDSLQEMQARALESAVPGRTAGDVYRAAEAVAEERGLGDVFMTRAVTDFRYVGHGVGVEIDEGPLLAPSDDTPLAEGMVLAIEPKVVIPGWGGMTLEDTVVVTRGGAQPLTGTGTELEIAG